MLFFPKTLYLIVYHSSVKKQKIYYEFSIENAPSLSRALVSAALDTALILPNKNWIIPMVKSFQFRIDPELNILSSFWGPPPYFDL
jgi:hypothetical protein